MRNLLFIIILIFNPCSVLAQDEKELRVRVNSQGNRALPGATVCLLHPDSSIFRTAITDATGLAVFDRLAGGRYLVKVSATGHLLHHGSLIDLDKRPVTDITVELLQGNEMLGMVTVTVRKQFVERLPDKTLVNVEAGITNEGATVLEVLEKSPGITVDRNGNISLKGKPSVLILIDGKLTQLAGADLQNLLNGMSASQVDVIEIMDTPPARYDAAGNAGIINIRTKKSRQKGFNGTFSTSYGQGIYPKTNNSLVLNYRKGSFNYFLTYSYNHNVSRANLYARRRYFRNDGSVLSAAEQSYFTKGRGNTHTLRTGADYFVGAGTTIGMALTGTYLDRHSRGTSVVNWMDEYGTTDSIINTGSQSGNVFRQGGINLNARHVFSEQEELTVNVDLVGYNMHGRQYFENKVITSQAPAEISRGDIPTRIGIFSAKADYFKQFDLTRLEAGAKTSRVSTTNLAQYYLMQNNNWEVDARKSNRFLYTENIHALYTSLQHKKGQWEMQGGLRYEYTTYNASQLAVMPDKDSSFKRLYHSLFPTVFTTYRPDSLNSFSLKGGRRIDRPPFQKLNPFIFIINKYTYQQGNPYLKPQYTWNIALSHSYRNMLSTELSYSFSNDYFSQVFLRDPVDGTITYTDGNIGRMQNLGLSVGLQLAPASWWTLSGELNLNRKRIEGMVGTDAYGSTINQASINLSNQLQLARNWRAELSGFYITRNQNDLQEILEPNGQLSAGIARQVARNRGTVRFAVRDIFFTQLMAGWSYFQQSDEYFRFRRDSRVATLSFSWRFGQSMKLPRRSDGAASEEIRRVSTDN